MNLRRIRVLGYAVLLLILVSSVRLATADPFLNSDDPEKLFAENSVHLIYIDAANCPDCEKFNQIYFRKFKKTELATKIYFTRIKTTYYQDTDRDKDWPEYLQWVRDKTDVRKGAPRFIVMSGRLVVANHYGNSSWKKDVIRKLARLTGVDLKASKPKSKSSTSQSKSDRDK